ncbi:MAG: site-specific DNA-methyltransferase [Endomicrobium sp.]|jgi:hypothetical protein|nr:site-specific DNA-methyltransferase [Endomicrobium sp.]
MYEKSEYLTIKEASVWAAHYLKRNVTAANISYLIQYGRIPKVEYNGLTQILKSDLKKYYSSVYQSRQGCWKEKLGQDLNWSLSFEHLKETDTTKHVHRLHPYKGKFIPQLAEYFLDTHTDRFKTQVYFKSGDIVLDPFCGSGTTLVAANELGLHCIGVDVSSFNALISNCKIAKYDVLNIMKATELITVKLYSRSKFLKILDFEKILIDKLKEFNSLYFPSPEYKYKLKHNIINEAQYGSEKEKEFLSVYKQLLSDYKISTLKKDSDRFLDKWYFVNVRDELYLAFNEIKQIKDLKLKKILALILSRTMRLCRATTHSDLSTLVKPIETAYYCPKHGKICKPVFSILKWWQTYSKDTINRLNEFEKLRSDTLQYCLTGDSRTVDLPNILFKQKADLAALVQKQKISGIFSSPPYVGLIDYHEQHAYAYDLFGFKRRDELEIGSLSAGQTKTAQRNYIDGISKVLHNCKKYLRDNYNVFLVANDKYNLYPEIAEKSAMKIINQFKRPVLNRTEKDKGAYSEIIFHLKDNE